MDALLGTAALEDLRRRTSFKWRAYSADVLPAFVAEMDFDIAPAIKDEVIATVTASDTGYPEKGELGQAFAEFAAARLGWSPDPDLVVPIPDVMTGLAEVVIGLTPPGSAVAISPPVYPPFFFRMRLLGREIAEAPLRPHPAEGGVRYELDLDALDRVLGRDDVRAYLLCSPHNPVGRVWSRDDLLAVADVCARHDTQLFVDEIHAPLVLPGAGQVPFLSLDHPITERVIAFTSATKAWNIPGLKCGLALAGSERMATILAERWDALLPAHVGLRATVAAFRRGLPWLDAVLGQLDQNRALLSRLLAEHLPDVGYTPPEASFLAWLDCRALGLGDDPAATFLERGRVALNPGPDFGDAGRGFARLNAGTSPGLLTEIVRRMAVALGRAPEQSPGPGR